MTKIKIGDDVKVGDKNFEKTDDGGTLQDVVIQEKNYTRDGVIAKIAKLENELTKFQEILADIDE